MAGMFFAVGALLLFAWSYAVCAMLVVVQERRLATFVPAQAVIVRSEVRGYITSKGRTIRAPYIAYRYSAQGLNYEGDTLYPGEELPVVGNFLVSNGRQYSRVVDATASWGPGRLTAAYPVGKSVIVHHSPALPSDVYLIAQPDRLAYYLGLVFAAGLWLAGCGLISLVRGAGRAEREPEADRTHSSRAEQRLGSMSRGLLLFVPAFVFLMFPLLLHRAWLGGVSNIEWILVGAFVVMTGFVLALLLRTRRLHSHLGDAKLSVFPGTPRLGEPMGMVLTIKVRRPVRVIKAEMQLECQAKTHGKESRCFSKSLKVDQDRTIASGDELRVETTFDLPATLEAPHDKRAAITYSWLMIVYVTFDGLPTYGASFPLHVAE